MSRTVTAVSTLGYLPLLFSIITGIMILNYGCVDSLYVAFFAIIVVLCSTQTGKSITRKILISTD
ncbi:hypothetical protein GCM10007978_37600 [Shewanella hanedai]|nr:hypothetical protein GCM10007978_37600 [Shewanella hanedai]